MRSGSVGPPNHAEPPGVEVRGQMRAFVTAGAGFLAAVLWFDLMHDVQVVGHRGTELPPPVLESIAGYYRRVTTEARPMNRLVAAAMLGTIAAVGLQLAHDSGPEWVAVTALVLSVMAVALAGFRTVPNAVRLGGRGDSSEAQSRLARRIFRDHLACLAGIGLVLLLELAFGK